MGLSDDTLPGTGAPSIVTSQPRRSPVPDLLFDDIREARIDDIRPLLDDPSAIDASTPLHRVTVFLTYRCNLACPYCKTIARTKEELLARPEKSVTYALDDVRALLDSHAGTPIRHLHFTGGEASHVRELPSMIRLAVERGVERVSIDRGQGRGRTLELGPGQPESRQDRVFGARLVLQRARDPSHREPERGERVLPLARLDGDPVRPAEPEGQHGSVRPHRGG